MKNPEHWQYHVLNGRLSFDNQVFLTPPEYIRAFNEFYNDLENSHAYLFFKDREKKYQSHPEYYDDRLDYLAIEIPTQVGITQLWGRRYHDQQDAYAVGELKEVAGLKSEQITAFLMNVFDHLQTELTQRLAEEAANTGTTACLCVLTQKAIYTVHVGDSVAFYYVLHEDGRKTLTQLNLPLHRAGDKNETVRIERFLSNQPLSAKEKLHILAGLRNKYDPRLSNLAVTAALGDNDLEKFGLRHQPDAVNIQDIEPNAGTSYLILASDGLTESLSVSEIETHLARSTPLDAPTLSQSLAKAAFTAHSSDNITVIVKAIPKIEFVPMYAAVFDGHGGPKISHYCASIIDDICKKLVNDLR